ncbi:hypothetical protein HYH02_002920 [Chlamydomonas schloesseri]|uniref:Uncharacterized protein n=1 Tax=Chlamydomonas schloesseri TaxID=2026947 RepID=A0A835WSW6_9CHLO|nr:hypothetical protein HYH02_002920 [Chlamydomonas schloesseri]|eukprot:KAG2452688.1 hypothetical protein HYH02_002920 [Chlamydomonas schloesseri]
MLSPRGHPRHHHAPLLPLSRTASNGTTAGEPTQPSLLPSHPHPHQLLLLHHAAPKSPKAAAAAAAVRSSTPAPALPLAAIARPTPGQLTRRVDLPPADEFPPPEAATAADPDAATASGYESDNSYASEEGLATNYRAPAGAAAAAVARSASTPELSPRRQ